MKDRNPEWMWRVHQRAHMFADRRKKADKRKARGRSFKGDE